jgi:hypothetical protein
VDHAQYTQLNLTYLTDHHNILIFALSKNSLPTN